MIVYDPGDTAVLPATFTNVATGNPIDQTTISARIRRPDGTATDYAAADIDHTAVGSYELQVAIANTPGEWTYKFVGDTDVIQGSFYVRPDATSSDPYGRDLCTLRDVFRLAPGFDPTDDENADIVASLGDLIPAESQSIYKETGREFVAIVGADTRVFDVTAAICQRRSIPIGDAATITAVEIIDFDGVTSLGVLDPIQYVALPRIREDWRPITRLKFPSRPGSLLRLAPGRTLEVTATWGFPKIPVDLRQACAKRVLLRYVADNANSGTRLADAIDDTFNIGALLRSAREVVESYSGPCFA